MTKKPQTSYRCGECENAPEMNFNEMMEHCKSVHGETVHNTQVQKEMTCHIDGADFFTYTFKITTGLGLEFYQHQCFPRKG